MTVMGIDLGGTSTRALMVDTTGRQLGRGQAGGANLRSAAGGVVAAAEAVSAAASGAVEAAGGRRPEVIVVGASGAGAARHDEVSAAMRETLAGICGRVRVENDLATAFRSASESPDGYLLLSGTGAVAARFRDGSVVGRADGLGWILGDVGSGLWIGWQGLRAVAADVDGRGPATTLSTSLIGALDIQPVTGDPAQDLVRRIDELVPAQMARLAPLVLEAAGPDRVSADEVSAGICREAASGLLNSLRAVVGEGPRTVVLAGGVLAHDTVVRELVTGELEGWTVLTASDPVLGAVRIAREMIAAPTRDVARKCRCDFLDDEL
ncbi:N-acetylglucosamine kinase [Acidipropionibacterium virtanenii]|uniref:N-acetylmuramic acid/N-acetylglucosamine kinase n=1 Tax=Acidipropionibacterium virtanenii TaxID=2057246 RepID=A0A344UPS6_9ACTN|nr:BadF/BadG/BcrA/BcrD ATPase family protein [Acidipropionibacterium virtanenii]AXE37274.1 N-acetylmuramic acid/N-acetylglucosamine kinase [Acidipropionibacterium virtanenii]